MTGALIGAAVGAVGGAMIDLANEHPCNDCIRLKIPAAFITTPLGTGLGALGGLGLYEVRRRL